MVNNIDATLAALADPTRRQVIDLLKIKPRRAGELNSQFTISGPAMSRHLRVLREAGLIEEQRDASDNRARVFQLRAEPFAEMQEWLQAVEGFWSDQLQTLKALAEQRFAEKYE